jgi:hypothetical protein
VGQGKDRVGKRNRERVGTRVAKGSGWGAREGKPVSGKKRTGLVFCATKSGCDMLWSIQSNKLCPAQFSTHIELVVPFVASSAACLRSFLATGDLLRM